MIISISAFMKGWNGCAATFMGFIRILLLSEF